MRTNPLRRGAFAAALVLLLVGSGAACSGDDDGSSDVSATATISPGPVSAISGVVQVSADGPARLGATATAVDGDHEVEIPPPAEAADAFELPLVGLRPETEYEVRVEGVEEPLSFTTGALPANFPPFELEVDKGQAQEGLTLISLKPWSPPEEGAGAAPAVGGYLAVIDHDGFVVWYHPTDLGVLDARQLPNGNVLFTYDEVVLKEVDVLGRDVRELAGRVALDLAPEHVSGRRRASDQAMRVDTDSFHHDAGPLPNGNMLLLSTELREFTGPSQCEEDTPEATYPVISDVVVEVDPESGEVVREWPLLDVYDPFERPGSELCVEGPLFAPPNFFYGEGVGARDWTHGNSVVLDEDRNALIVSLRHLSAVIAIRYEDDDEGPAGELLWELGPDGTLDLDGEPSYYQHAAEVLDDGDVLVYDNGNTRPSAPLGGDGAPPYSRAVIYEVDDEDGTARQVWDHVLTHDDGRPVFTAFLGDADALANGNILISHGAIADERGGLTARLIEVVRDSGEVVFDLRVGDRDHAWTVYRSERIATLTPSPPSSGK